MYCIHCGTELSDSAVMCWRCGRAVQPVRAKEPPRRPEQTSPYYDAPDDDWYQPRPSAGAQTNYGPEVQPPARKNPKKLLIGICIAIVIVAVIAVVIGRFAVYSEPSASGVTTVGESQGFVTHQELIQAYCDYYSAADEAGMVTLYPQALRDYLADAGYEDTSDFLYDRDDWYGYYGETVTQWMISDVYVYDTADFRDISSELGVDVGSAVDVEVTMTFEGEAEYWTYDFDLIEIGGTWFLFSVW